MFKSLVVSPFEIRANVATVAVLVNVKSISFIVVNAAVCLSLSCVVVVVSQAP
jgi:hypothetical protein